MKTKGILKLTVGTKERTMHYITKDNKVYLFTLCDSHN